MWGSVGERRGKVCRDVGEVGGNVGGWGNLGRDVRKCVGVWGR